MQDQLLQHADEVIEESRRLVDELWATMSKGKQLEERVHHLRQRRIEEQSQKK